MGGVRNRGTEVPRGHDLRFHDATVASVHMDQFWPTKWIFLSPHTQRYIVPTRSIEAIASVPICSIPSRAPVSWCISLFQTAPLTQQNIPNSLKRYPNVPINLYEDRFS